MKRKTLTTAVMAGLTGLTGMVSVANAVNVNPDGLGQVLLYPYYTARGGNDTLISVVNTTSVGKAVKIRFIEALNSREVLDFNIYLSEHDVWTGSVTDLDAIDRGNGPGLLVNDTTCTAPYIFGQGGAQPFVDFQFSVDPDETTEGNDTNDGGPQGIERAASGYIEIIEMGTLIEGGIVDEWVTHDPETKGMGPDDFSPATPVNCAAVVDLWRAPPSGVTNGGGDTGTWDEGSGGDSTFSFNTEAGATGGIFGSASIINVAEGTMFSYNATAIDAFWPAGTTVHENPGNVLPNLASSDRTVSNVFVNGEVETIDWTNSIFAVNATLTLDQLFNEYNVNDGLAANTEWVLTFPTKRFHVDAAPGGFRDPAGEPIPPFTELWTKASPESCDALFFRFFDREEQTPMPEPGEPGDVIVSPPPPPEAPVEAPVFELCREANVIRFSNDGTLPDETEILKEPLRSDGDAISSLSYTNLNLPEAWTSGWVKFEFGGSNDQFAFQSTAGINESENEVVVEGLPIIGFGVTTFSNGVLEGGTVLRNFGGTFQHRGTRSTVAAPD